MPLRSKVRNSISSGSCETTKISERIMRIMRILVKEKRGKIVTLQSRVARNKFCWGRGVRAVRAGSIGRDDPRLEENTASPKWGAGGLGPRPLPEDPSAL